MADEKKNDSDTQPIAPPPVAHHPDNDFLAIASERLSQVRYVFIVQIEDGVASARSRSCLEYADAVLMAWPEDSADGLRTSDEVDLPKMREAEQQMEKHIAAFRLAERADQTDEMGDELVRVADAAAIIRRAYQPDVRIPTLKEISGVVNEEWNQEMGALDTEELENTDELRHDVQVATMNGVSGNIPSAHELEEKQRHHAREKELREERLRLHEGSGQPADGPAGGRADGQDDDSASSAAPDSGAGAGSSSREDV